MINENGTEPLAVGTWVKIRNSGFERGRIVEYRGPLGPRGARIYRIGIRLARGEKPIFTEVREDQLEILPSKSD